MTDRRMTREQHDALMESEGSGQIAAYASRFLPEESLSAIRSGSHQMVERIVELEAEVAALQLTGTRAELQSMLDALGQDFERMRDRAKAAECERDTLRALHMKNAATMEAAKMRLAALGLSSHELDLAIRETRAALSPSRSARVGQ
jgi:hypothetical protein